MYVKKKKIHLDINSYDYWFGVQAWTLTLVYSLMAEPLCALKIFN